VLQACGSPAQGSVIDEQIKRGRNTAEEVSSTPGAQLEKLVSVFRWCTVAVFAPEPRFYIEHKVAAHHSNKIVDFTKCHKNVIQK